MGLTQWNTDHENDQTTTRNLNRSWWSYKFCRYPRFDAVRWDLAGHIWAAKFLRKKIIKGLFVCTKYVWIEYMKMHAKWLKMKIQNDHQIITLLMKRDSRKDETWILTIKEDKGIPNPHPHDSNHGQVKVHRHCCLISLIPHLVLFTLYLLNNTSMELIWP